MRRAIESLKHLSLRYSLAWLAFASFSVGVPTYFHATHEAEKERWYVCSSSLASESYRATVARCGPDPTH